jgi:hypothetical protein
MNFVKRRLMFWILCSALIFSSCARRTPVSAPGFVSKGEGFAYLLDPDGRWIIVTSNTKDLDEAMKMIQPGPASVDKLNLWIVTPLRDTK